jgi:hypothetical protein
MKRKTNLEWSLLRRAKKYKENLNSTVLMGGGGDKVYIRIRFFVGKEDGTKEKEG